MFNGGLTMRIDQDGRLVMWGGRLVHPESVVAAPTLDAEGAIRGALAHLAERRLHERGHDARSVPTTKLVVHVDGRP